MKFYLYICSCNHHTVQNTHFLEGTPSAPFQSISNPLSVKTTLLTFITIHWVSHFLTSYKQNHTVPY